MSKKISPIVLIVIGSLFLMPIFPAITVHADSNDSFEINERSLISGNFLFQSQPSLRVLPNNSVRITSAKLISIQTLTGTATPNGMLTVNIFGIVMTIDASHAQITQPFTNQTMTLSNLAINDLLNIEGTINANTGVVTATRISDRTFQYGANINALQAQIQQLLMMISQLQAQLRSR